jgi:type II secretory pathway pseudopilin PulG
VIALVAFLVFLLLRNQRKHRQEMQALQQQALQQQALQQQANPYPLQERRSYVSQPHSGITAGYSVQNKEGVLSGSPPVSDTLGSPYESNFSRTPRDSHAPGYMGPTIPEMGAGPGG